MKKPPFIVLEGGEGSGKSTIMRTLKEEYGDNICLTREPGGSPYAELIRDAAIKNPLAKDAPPETTLCLMFAARYDNVTNTVIPALKNNIPVVSDRFDGSSYAYQVSSQSGILEDLFWILRARLVVQPDVYIFIDVDPREGLKRAQGRNASLLKGAEYDHFDNREVFFHENVRKGYKQFLQKVKEKAQTNSVIIDGNRPLEAVKRDVMNVIKKHIDMSTM